jgi:hypothetical protein
MDEKELEALKHEYSEANNNLRHYSGLRFAIFSVYFAVAGGLISVAFGIVDAKLSNQASVSLMAKIGGLLVTIVFFMFEMRLELLVRHHQNVANTLERPLGYRQMSTRPQYRFLKTYYYTWGLFILLILFWIVVICKRTYPVLSSQPNQCMCEKK